MVVGGRLTGPRLVTIRTATTNTASPARKSRAMNAVHSRTFVLSAGNKLDCRRVRGVFIATMPYGAVVGTAYAPLVIGVLAIAVASRQARRRRR